MRAPDSLTLKVGATIAAAAIVVGTALFLIFRPDEPQPPVNPDGDFRTALLTDGFNTDQISPAADFAKAFCDGADTTDVDMAVAISRDGGISAGLTLQQVDSILEAGAVSYCPKYLDDLDGAL